MSELAAHPGAAPRTGDDAREASQAVTATPIAITGIGLVSALGSELGATWRAFCDGDASGIRTLAADDPRRDRASDATPPPDCARAGWVRGFSPRDRVRSPQLRRMDWGSRMLAAAARSAFEDAGLLPLDGELREAAAIVAGSCFGNQRETATYLERVFTSGLGAGQPMLFPNLVLNAAGGYAAIELGIEGPNLSLSANEASGESALAGALDLLHGGTCAVACAGGFDEIGGIYLEALAERRLLHPDSLPPEAAARARRSGRGLRGAIVPGEGAAMLLLEPLERARARGARVYALLRGARTATVAGPAHLLPPDASAAARRMLEVAGPGAVDAVFGCSDGTAVRAAIDAAVVQAIAEQQAARPAYVPFRRLCGEFGAAGALGTALAALAVHAGAVPRGLGDAPPAASAAATAGVRCALVVGVARGGLVAPVVVAAAG
jgi:3-oxoacyl-(acyl-carrier-protein) synthase